MDRKEKKAKFLYISRHFFSAPESVLSLKTTLLVANIPLREVLIVNSLCESSLKLFFSFHFESLPQTTEQDEEKLLKCSPNW